MWWIPVGRRKATPEAVRALIVEALVATPASSRPRWRSSSRTPKAWWTTAWWRSTTGQGQGHRLPGGRRRGRRPDGSARLLRHAIATGVDPVPIVAVLASQLRQLVKVGSAGQGGSQQLAKQLGMAPWQVDKAVDSSATGPPTGSAGPSGGRRG